jgi:hypothetical protein
MCMAHERVMTEVCRCTCQHVHGLQWGVPGPSGSNRHHTRVGPPCAHVCSTSSLLFVVSCEVLLPATIHVVTLVFGVAMATSSMYMSWHV